MTSATLHADADPARPRGGPGCKPSFDPRFGPPTPVKVLAAIAAFGLLVHAPPLALAVLGFIGWKAWQRRQAGEDFSFGPFARASHGVTNSAYAAHRRETLARLEAEARALAAHERAEREARDREAYEAFKAAQAEAASKADDGSDGEAATR